MVVLATPFRRRSAAVLTATAAIALLSACAPPPASVPQPRGAAYETMPVPGRTIAPESTGDLDLSGQHVALIVPGQDAATLTLADAARDTAEAAGASVETFPVAAGGTVDDAFAEAVANAPEIVVGIGERAVDVFSYETAQRLEQEFLLLGGQLPEPTQNVTAVIWPGATSRGSGAPADGDIDRASITATRAAEAAASGLESVRSGVVGVVLHLGG